MLKRAANRIGAGLTKTELFSLSFYRASRSQQYQNQAESAMGRGLPTEVLFFWCWRFWPIRKLNRDLDLRTCARLETPLRIRFKSSAIELFVSGALHHSVPY